MSDPTVLASLRELYIAPEWIVLGEVRSGTGYREEVRYADGLAVNLWPSSAVRLIGFEFKVHPNARFARADLLREIQDAQKALAIGRFCAEWYLVVRAPWKRTLFSLDELPEGVGLIEVGTGKPVKIRHGERREPEPMTEAFMLSLVRSATEQAKDQEASEHHAQLLKAPMRTVSRPMLTREHMGLVCGHVVARGLGKKRPDRVRCTSCAEGLPTDRQMLEGVIRDMGHAELAEAAELIERRRALSAWAVGE